MLYWNNVVKTMPFLSPMIGMVSLYHIKMVMTGGWFIYLSVAELELLALTSATWNPE